MERKIGEIFKYDGEWYQCVKGMFCNLCAFDSSSCNAVYAKGRCSAKSRDDETDVIFKKLKKLGEPYKLGEVLIQQYQGIAPIVLPEDSGCLSIFRVISSINVIEIEIKQNKEEMEEKKIQHYDCFFDGKSSKSNLKPFDLKAAKAGKPVCTRDGRKARIICFDRDCDMHIVALVSDPLGESVHYYLSNGKVDFDKNNDNDLMMLSEKKVGWINVYKGGKMDADFIYPTKADAVENIFQPMKAMYIDTIKVNWSE